MAKTKARQRDSVIINSEAAESLAEEIIDAENGKSHKVVHGYDYLFPDTNQEDSDSSDSDVILDGWGEVSDAHPAIEFELNDTTHLITEAEKRREPVISDAWKFALSEWSNPLIPRVIAMESERDADHLGDIGEELKSEFAFMKYPEFQTYANIERIRETFSANPGRGLEGILTHEVGHRFCPYDKITLLRLMHSIRREIRGMEKSMSLDAVSSILLNYYTDMCINTKLVSRGNESIPWLYKSMYEKEGSSKSFDIYLKSMEIAWNKKILPSDKQLNLDEIDSATRLANLFHGNYFHKTRWDSDAVTYAKILIKYFEEEKEDRKGIIGNTSKNIPQKLDEKTKKELVRRIANSGADGLPGNPLGIKEFQNILEEFGDEKESKEIVTASKTFYETLAEPYDVEFEKKPFGKPRINPFRPVKWNPGNGVSKLDVNHSVIVGGRMIPGVNTYYWENRKRDVRGGSNEIVPDLDIYIDSSASMVNPVDEISLPVLAGFVVARKANKKGAFVRATNFSSSHNILTAGPTKNLNEIYGILVGYFGNGTSFPAEMLTDYNKPRQVIIITDSYLGNNERVADSIREFRKMNEKNSVSIYAISSSPDVSLKDAGAEIIQGTTTDIFRKVIGKANEVYKL